MIEATITSTAASMTAAAAATASMAAAPTSTLINEGKESSNQGCQTHFSSGKLSFRWVSVRPLTAQMSNKLLLFQNGRFIDAPALFGCLGVKMAAKHEMFGKLSGLACVFCVFKPEY